MSRNQIIIIGISLIVIGGVVYITYKQKISQPQPIESSSSSTSTTQSTNSDLENNLWTDVSTWKNYNSILIYNSNKGPSLEYSVKYPRNFDAQTSGGFYASFPRDTFKGTNFVGASFGIQVWPENELSANQCLLSRSVDSNGKNQPLTQSLDINGIRFFKEKYGGGGNGTDDSFESYRTVWENKCVDISLQLTTLRFVEGINTPLPLVDENKIWPVLEGILSNTTFKVSNLP